MRQAGILAAGALHAVEHQRARLADDHRSARAFAEVLEGADGIEAPLAEVETNIVRLTTTYIDAQELVQRTKAHGILLNATGKRTLRAVTHLDVSESQVKQAAQSLRSLARP
jgi:threonine aldolase